MAQQTAMQILWDWIDANCHEDNFNINDARDMSLKLEKEQIQKAFSDGQELSINNPLLPHYSSEEYYNDTYTQGSE